ncbi:MULTISPECIES: YkoF family thiamine/hydroxymethylpyrimidine-binding protein [Marinobacter]|uniref:YkoF family thiamine/hydroxymethylpyrimidine-binding protein n=1 Tax=Marinobacter xiaoshiensis TaxID=3073652 RepID=A0ABU2HIL7_9GAMM|nr:MULTISPECIES: YkoF family thiamine/hydroxymethylpyrimidine-binding protein [unclassified Marinobacter]MBK1874393.1 thiamine-binding protein [Marinobacter sp. 1-3A]MDS1310155.1 YkoF family thiamine/hydroxymethylpyrimidine-binding protein [Marinobacter sp. F60267]
MFLSVQLSCYPLKDDYKQPIWDLIARLEETGLQVVAGRMSTEIFGEYDEVMKVLSDAMRWSFETYGKSVFVAKIMEGDRRPK